MPIDAIIFMTVTWVAVISLTTYCYIKMLRGRKISADEDEKFPSDPVK